MSWTEKSTVDQNLAVWAWHVAELRYGPISDLRVTRAEWDGGVLHVEAIARLKVEPPHEVQIHIGP